MQLLDPLQITKDTYAVKVMKMYQIEDGIEMAYDEFEVNRDSSKLELSSVYRDPQDLLFQLILKRIDL